jgi:hypothetical protein
MAILGSESHPTASRCFHNAAGRAAFDIEKNTGVSPAAAQKEATIKEATIKEATI